MHGSISLPLPLAEDYFNVLSAHLLCTPLEVNLQNDH